MGTPRDLLGRDGGTHPRHCVVLTGYHTGDREEASQQDTS